MLGCNQGESQRAATDGRCLETTVCRSLTEAGTDGRPFTTAQVLVTVNANDQRLHWLLISGFLTSFHSEQSCEVKKALLCFLFVSSVCVAVSKHSSITLYHQALAAELMKPLQPSAPFLQILQGKTSCFLLACCRGGSILPGSASQLYGFVSVGCTNTAFSSMNKSCL